ncbi:Ig-like domain-containing protein, partial [Shewanella nanhaiensis]
MKTLVTTQPGTVLLVKGDIKLQLENTLESVSKGEQLLAGATLIIEDNADIEIAYSDGTYFSNLESTDRTVEEGVTATSVADAREIQTIQDAIIDGDDPTTELPDTAAGGTLGNQGGSDFVSLDRTASETIAATGFNTDSAPQDEFLVTDTLNEPLSENQSNLANDFITIDEDGVATGNVLDNDSDVDDELAVLSFEVNGTTYGAGTTVELEGGTLVINQDGSYTFTPNENWNGTVPVITYTTNTGATATLNIEVTPVADGAPQVTINTDANNDGLISNDELNDSNEINVTISLEGTGAMVGDVLIVNGIEIVLTADDIFIGSINVNLPAPAEGETITVVATVTDSAGNTSPEGTDTATVDTIAPTITVDAPDTTNDTTPTITGTTDAEPGSTITVVITDSTGTEQTVTTTVNPDGTFTVDVTDPVAEGPITVVATVTDPAGNTGTATDTGGVDTTPPTITVDVPDTTNDTTPTITGTTDAEPGSTITVVITDSTGTEQTVTTTVNPDGTYTVDVTTPTAEGPITVVATVTDPSGNTGTATDTGDIDTTPPTITVDVPDTTNDTTPTITGTTDAEPGSTITVVITDSTGTEQTVTTTVDPDGTYTVDVTDPVTEGPITVVATVTDPAGNTGTTTDTGDIDTTEPTITVDVPDATNDTTPTITGTTDAEPGSTITVVVTDSTGTEQTITTTVEPDGTYTVDVIDPTAEGPITVVATVTDPAGNTGTATDTGEIDTTDPIITVDLPDTTNDTTPTITGTTDAEPGSTITVVVTDSSGTEQTVTTTVDPDGTYTVDVTDPVTEGPITVVATVTDPAGNTGTSTDTGTIDITIGTPVVEITEDTNNDGYLNDPELNGQVDISITLGEGTELGDTFTVTDQDGNVIFDGPVTQGMIDNGLNLAIDPPATGTDLVITATVTDPSGNIATGSDSATLDYGVGTGAPAGPSVTIDEDTNGDGYISDTELDGQINITVELGTGTVVGDTLVITDQDGNELFNGTVTQEMLDNGQAIVMDVPVTGTDIVVTATVTDPAGNTATGSDAATLDYGTGAGAPVSPTVTINEDANEDGVINDAELDGQIDITVELGEGTEVGDTLVITDQAGNTLFDGPVTQEMIDNGLTLAIDPPASGTDLVITADITDPAGNTASGSGSATLDYGTEGAPNGPNVTIEEDVNNDGYINDAEVDGQLNITIDLDSGTQVGDTLVVTDQDGNIIFSDTVTQDMLDNGQTVVIDTPATGTDLVVTATVTDPSGNTATGSDSATLDYGNGAGAPEAPIVNITEDTNGDGTITDAELDGQINITVDLGTGTQVGDTITVTDQTGDVLYTGPVTQDMLDNGIDIAIDAPANGTDLVISATITDPAGNTATGNDSATMDYDDSVTVPAAPNVTIVEDTNGDGFINDAELEGQINITIELGTNTLVGDTLVVTDQDGNELFNGTVTQEMLDNGLDLAMDPPATGTNLVITATVTDTLGTQASGSDNALLDYGSGTGAPAAPTVELTEDSNNDGYINDSELEGQINGTVTLGEGTVVGDTITVTDQDNNVIFSGPVTQEMIDDGLDLAIDAPATGTDLVVTATITDPAGNSAQGSDAATLDYGTGTGAPAAPLVEIVEDSNDDGFINDAELDGQIDISVTLGSGTSVGDTLVVTDQDGNVIFIGTVTQDMLTNGVPVTMDAPATGTDLVVTATITDAAGNSATGSDSTTLDYGTGSGAPAAPTVELTEDANDDGYINDAELDGQIDATVTLGEGTEVGDTVTITDQDNNVIFSGPVTQEMIDNGLAVTIDPPASGTNLVVTATITDPAGNTTSGSDNALLDYGTGTGGPATPTVVIDEDVNNDGVITDFELIDQIDISVTLGAGTEVGDTLLVTDQDGNELFSGVVTQAMLDDGLAVVMNIPVTGTEIIVTATVTDTSGNTAVANDSATLDYNWEITPPVAPTVEITEDVNDDGYINSTELDGQINITVTLDAGTNVGENLVVTDQAGNELFNGTVTQEMLDNGLQLGMDAPATGTSITVTASLTNIYGMVLTDSDNALLDYGTGTGAPASPTVDITEDANEDGFINSAELDGQINITVTLGEGTQ